MDSGQVRAIEETLYDAHKVVLKHSNRKLPVSQAFYHRSLSWPWIVSHRGYKFVKIM